MDPEQVAALNREDIANAIAPGALRTGQIIHLALTLAPLIFAGVIVLLHQTGSMPAEKLAGDSPTNILLAVIGSFWFSATLAGIMLPGLYFKPQNLANRLRRGRGDDVPARVAALLVERQTFGLIRAALYESMAFVGLIVPLLAVVNGTLADEPQAYLGALPLATHLAAAAVTYPSREAVIAFVFDRMVRPLRRLPGGA